MRKNPNPQGKTLCEIFMEEPTKPMPDHTPGPWTAYGCTIYSGPNRIAQTCDSEYDGIPTAEMEINANLIATAPELLEALKWALEQIADDLDPDHQEAFDAASVVAIRAGGYL